VDDLDGYAQAICTLAEKPDQWKEMSLAGLKAAKYFTYEKYLLSLEEMFQDYYHQSPFNPQFIQELQQTWQNLLHNDLSA
jgi:flagellar biosynthesis chaperone FliJ